MSDQFDTPTSALDDISGSYTLDPTHTRLGFSARHAMVTTVRGSFTALEGTATISAANPADSEVRLRIPVDSIDTGTPDRDAHLRSPDFFDVENHPEITFESTEVSADGTEWTIVGELTIKGVGKPATLVFEQLGSARDPFGNLRVGFEGGGTINRKDWGLAWNVPLDSGGLLVSDKIKLDIDVSAIQSGE
ncbi:MAG: YceI family protein [Nocardioides sp.]